MWRIILNLNVQIMCYVTEALVRKQCLDHSKFLRTSAKGIVPIRSLRGEEQNREEGEMVQKSREEGEIRAKM